MRSGAPKPDISTPEKLKEALIAAKAIAYSDPSKGGASGVHFAKVAERLGIADQVKAKSKHPETAGLPGKLLLDGTAELAISQVPELLEVQGTDLVGPLPGDLQNITKFAGGVVTGAKQPDAAAAFLKFLQTPEALATIKARDGACLRPVRRQGDRKHAPSGTHTTIITGFSISVLNAPISSAPSAPSTAR